MKQNSMLMITFLLLGVLSSACYGSFKNPAQLNMPAYMPARPPGFSFEGSVMPAPTSCPVHAVDLIGAWVAAGSPEKDPFPFTDINGKPCQGAFEADVLPLFGQANLWYPGALSCRTCHGPDVNVSYARMNLSDYQGILAGSGRESVDSKGQDILGGGNWEQATLYNMLTTGQMPPNTPKGLAPKGPLVYAGVSK
jgi:hypothetical protein